VTARSLDPNKKSRNSSQELQDFETGGEFY